MNKFFDFGDIDDNDQKFLFDEYLNKLNGIKKLSDIKLIILNELYIIGETFPKSWVESRRLLAVTKQKAFDRRVRELKDEYGCDIESQVVGSVYCYRLKSDKLKEGNRRNYLTQSEKLGLFNRYNYRCQICNIVVDGGIRGLQADHRIPLSRGGRDDKSNWQPLCNECNVSKKSACRNCSKDCRQCIWAYPEMGKVFPIKISREVIDILNDKFNGNDQLINEFCVECIKNKLFS